MQAGVYYILNTQNDRIYVGIASDLDFRFRTHRTTLQEGRHQNPALQFDWVQYGDQAFEFGILTTVPVNTRSNELRRLESIFVHAYQADDPRFGYNVNQAVKNKLNWLRRRHQR